jgi:hypothetical protein
MRSFTVATFAAAFIGLSSAATEAQSALAPGPNAVPAESVIAVPPAPPLVAAPPSAPIPSVPAAPPPPGLVPLSPPPVSSGNANSDNGANSGNADNANPDNGGNTPATPIPGQTDTTSNQIPDTAPTPPNTWVPDKIAKIGVLDKIDGSVSELSIPVGGQSTVGDLQINVLACVTRPPSQVPDAAIFFALQSTDNLSAPPAYRGWLVRSTPGAAVAGDASETLRVIDCS